MIFRHVGTPFLSLHLGDAIYEAQARPSLLLKFILPLEMSLWHLEQLDALTKQMIVAMIKNIDLKFIISMIFIIRMVNRL